VGEFQLESGVLCIVSLLYPVVLLPKLPNYASEVANSLWLTKEMTGHLLAWDLGDGELNLDTFTSSVKFF
jgi:hypothetical protein